MRGGADDLGGLAEILLDLAAHQQVELLVGAAKLDVGLQGHRVVGLRQGVEQLVDGDRGALFVALREIVALEHAGHGVFAGQADEVLESERREPLAVVADHGFRAVEDLKNLLFVGFGVGLDGFAGEWGAGDVAACGIADHGRTVADDENHGMAEILKMLHLADEDGVAEVQVRGGRVEADFHAQRTAEGQARFEVLFADELHEAFLKIGDLLVWCHGDNSKVADGGRAPETGDGG